MPFKSAESTALAVRSLEGDVGNLFDMARIAASHVEHMMSRNPDEEGNIKLHESHRQTALFCVYHLAEMIEAFRDSFYDAIEEAQPERLLDLGRLGLDPRP